MVPQHLDSEQLFADHANICAAVVNRTRRVFNKLIKLVQGFQTCKHLTQVPNFKRFRT